LLLCVVLAAEFATLRAFRTTSAQTAGRPLERADAFQVAYGLSFRLDGCGDSVLGSLFRKAILEKFDRCPFSDEARRRFHSWADSESIRMNGLLTDYVTQHGNLPDRLDGMNQSCRESRVSADYLGLRDRLDRYARGEISADAIIPDRCDVAAGAP
jgi:hypothetical protein